MKPAPNPTDDMHRPDHPSAVNGQFSPGDPGQGIDATVIQASWLNGGPLNELVNLVEGAGIVLDKNDETQVLQAVSAIAASASREKNLLWNGRMDVWQVGSGAASSGSAFTRTHADGWYMNPFGSTLTSSRQSFASGQIEVEGFPSSFLRVAKSGASPSSPPRIATFVEDVRAWSGATLTVSFYAKADAPVNVTLACIQDFGTGSSTSDVVAQQVVAVNEAWTRYSATFVLASHQGADIEAESHLRFEWRLPQDAVARTLDLAQAQVERGAAVTAFECLDVEAAELRAQRYLEFSWAPGSAFSATFAGAVSGFHLGSLSGHALQQRFRALKAKTPSVVWYSPDTGTASRIYLENGDTDLAVTAQGANRSSTGWPFAALGIGTTEQIHGHWFASAELTF